MKNMIEKIKKSFQPKLKLIKGTRFTSFAMIFFSFLIAAGILFAANMYYNIDTGEIVMEEINRVTGIIRATAGVIVGGGATQDPSAGYVFEVVGKTKLATTTVATGQLEFTGSDTYGGFQAPASYGTSTAKIYKLPQHGTTSPTVDYVLTWQSGDQLTWKSIGGAGGGDVNTVGDCTGPECFTVDGTGNILWFEGATANGFEIALTAADPGADYTITLPAANGTVALGTSTAGYATYWSATNTLAGEAYLAISRGGTGRGSWTQWGVLYADTTGSLTNTGGGSADNLLVGAGSSAPTWKTISQLLTQGNNISLTGTTNVTIATVNNPIFSTSVTSPLFLSTTTLAIQSGNGQDITIDSDSGRILLATGNWIETASGYKIGATSTEILREMIPILGFEMPVRCGTACETATTVSRTIEDYPFSSAAAGTDRIHKFVIRYADSTTTASSTWTVFNEDTSTTTTFQVPASASTDLAKGEAYITLSVTIPINTNDWHLRVQVPSGVTIQIYEIILAAYDKIK